MKNHFSLFATLCASALMGCSPIALVSATSSPQVDAPSGSKSEVEALFTQARAAQEAGQMQQAEVQYGHVLKKQPAHVGAINSMAVIYAQTARVEQAIALFHRALDIDPKAAYVHNNLGYTLLCLGDFEQAYAQLALAFALNPASPQTRKNIQRLAQDFGRVTGMESSNADTAAQAPDRSKSVLTAIAPNVFVLQSWPAASMEPMSVARLEGALDGVRIEVTNGAGIRYLAKLTATRLSALGAIPARLTNQTHFRQARTEIQFSPGQEDKAVTLSASLPLAVSYAASNGLRRDIQVRLILGHDMVGRVITSWLESSAGASVARMESEGWRWS